MLMTTKESAHDLLRAGTGIADAKFHQDQWEAIDLVANQGSRALVVQRTGWGKSAVYFIATKLIQSSSPSPKMTLIISPLIALMRNQVLSASAFGVKLGTINSSQTKEENERTGLALEHGRLDALIIAPEQLGNAKFRAGPLSHVMDRIGLLVIDEAHCISDWGHDFRPHYTRIVTYLQNLPGNLPVLATTATANKRVTADIAEQMGGDPTIIRGPLTRESLRLQTVHLHLRSERLAWLADRIHEERKRGKSSGVIYVSTVRDSKLVSDWLREQGINSLDYAGKLSGMSGPDSKLERPLRENLLYNNEIDVLVTTNALGMGYDKPDLGYVIHFQSPGSVIGYYQQVGRAGRGISEARGVLLTGEEDRRIQEFFIREAFPKPEAVKQILETCREHDSLTAIDLEKHVNLKRTKIQAALTFLSAQSPAPIIRDGYSWQVTPHANGYELPHDLIAEVTRWKERELLQMESYVSHENCLMKFLADELEDDLADSCGRCACCDPESSWPENFSQELGIQAEKFLNHYAIHIEPRKQLPRGDVFTHYDIPYKLEELKTEPGMILCRYGESGFGRIAKKAKSEDRYEPEILDASIDLIKRWKPGVSEGTPPTWVTYIPSSSGRTLVPKFAQLVAERLGIPCEPVLEFTGHKTAPQKSMQNSYQQCANLDGRFKIAQEIRPGEPVLLIDDACDSKWSFTITGALLKQAGSGPVYPFAVMDTSTG